MTPSRTLYVGMAVHTDSLAVASVAQDHHAEGVALGTIGTRQCDIDQLLRRLQSKSPPLVFVSDAGPGGYWLYRSLPTQGPLCCGVAPSVSPKTPGERVNPNRRDALTRARWMRSGDLTPVSVPPVDEAAMRDLGRAREETSRELQTAHFRLQALLLRHDMRSTGRAPWGPAHLRWLSDVVCPPPRSSSSAKHTSGPCPSRPHGWRAWSRHAKTTCRRGGLLPWSRPSRLCAGCSAPWP
jgi:transposase